MQKYLSVLVFMLAGTLVQAQDKLTLEECESQFLRQNLFLLAEEYNIEASEALVIQAGLWENPYFSAELNALNPPAGKAFDIGPGGQKGFAIEQLIYLGGQKKKEVELARSNAELASLRLRDLLRALKFQLRSAYFSIYYDNAAVATFDRQLNNLDSLISAYNEQVIRGNIPMKDVVRLQSLFLALQNDRIELVNKIIEGQGTLRLLLSTAEEISPDPSVAELQRYFTPLPYGLEALQERAVDNRPDLLWAKEAANASQLHLNWQRSLAVPNLNLGAAYDQRGGAFGNQVNLTMGIPLPLWNRNQGNIRYAEALVKQSAAGTDLQLVQVKSQVISAHQKYQEASKNYLLLSDESMRQFEQVYRGIYANFQRRNITLLEFTDFMESYQQSLYQYTQLRKVLVSTCEELNFVTGTMIFN